MKLSKQGIRQKLEELTRFFIQAENMVERIEQQENRIKVLEQRIENLTNDLETKTNELVIVRDRARREAGVLL